MDSAMALDQTTRRNKMTNKIKVVSAHAWEVVEGKKAALEAARIMEQNGWGTARFEYEEMDEEGAAYWVEIPAEDL
jgi:hypothetical protein